MLRAGAVIALLATLVVAAPVAAYEPVEILGTTNYLALTATREKGPTTIDYSLDVGVFEDVSPDLPGPFYVCLRVLETRRGVFVGSNFGCAFEAEQTRLRLHRPFRMVLKETEITIGDASAKCCLAGRTVRVGAVAEATSTVTDLAGCVPRGAGQRSFRIRVAAVAGELSVKNKEHGASGDASQYVFTEGCAAR